MNKAEEYLSQNKYAEHRNVTKGYIGRLVKEGRLHLIKAKLKIGLIRVQELFIRGGLFSFGVGANYHPRHTKR